MYRQPSSLVDFLQKISESQQVADNDPQIPLAPTDDVANPLAPWLTLPKPETEQSRMPATNISTESIPDLQPKTELLNQFQKLRQPQIVQPDLKDIETAPAEINPLDKAIEARKEAQRNAMLLAGMKDILSGAARTAGADVKFGDSVEKMLAQQGEQGVQDVLRKQQLEQQAQDRKNAIERQKLTMEKLQNDLAKGKLDLSNQQALSDPNSPQSKVIQDAFIGLQKTLGNDMDEETIRQQPGLMLTKLSPFMQSAYKSRVEADKLDMARERIEQNKKLLEQRKVEEDRRLAGFAKSFRDKMLSDKRFKDLKSQEQTFQQMPLFLDAAESGNQAGVAAIGTKLARAMGEVGVLTDADVKRYIGNESFKRKMLNWYSRGMKGEFAPETTEDIRDLVNLIQGRLNEQVIPIYSEYASTLSATYPGEIPMDKALRVLGAPGFVDPAASRMIQQAGQPKKTKDSAAPKENIVRRMTKDGRVAIFDADTKKFLRYEGE